MSAGSIHYKLGLDAGSLTKGLAAVGASVRGFMSSAAKLGELAGSLIAAPLAEVKAANDAAKAAFENSPEPGPEAPRKPGAVASLGKVEAPKNMADSFARVGLFVGSGGPAAQRFAQDTAKHTRDRYKWLASIDGKMTKGGAFV